MNLATDRTRPQNAGKPDIAGCREIPPSCAERLEWWFLSVLLFALWLLPWCFVLMPKPMQVYVRGVFVAVPLAWFLKMALPDLSERIGALARLHIPLISWGIGFAAGIQGNPWLLVFFAATLAAFLCRFRRDAPTCRLLGRDRTVISERDRTALSCVLLLFALGGTFACNAPAAGLFCFALLAIFLRPELRTRLLSRYDFDLTLVVAFSILALSVRGESLFVSTGYFFLGIPVAWLAVYLEPAREIDAPGDARDRRRRLLVTLIAAQYLLFPELLGKAAPYFLDSGSLAGIERLCALHPASGELRTLRDRYLGALGRTLEPQQETARPGPAFTTVAVAPPPAARPVLPFARLTVEVSLDDTRAPWRLTADMHLAYDAPAGGFPAAPGLALAADWTPLGAGPSGELRFLRRVERAFDPAETNVALIIETPTPAPAAFAVERFLGRSLRRRTGPVTLHVAVDGLESGSRAGDAEVMWEGALPWLLLTASAAPPVRVDGGGRSFIIHAAGWGGLADRFGRLTRALERLEETLPVHRREITVFLGGLCDLPFGGFSIGDAVWVMGERLPSYMSPHFRYVLDDRDPAAPYDADERFAILVHEFIHALTEHPRVMHGDVRLYEGIVTYLAARVARDGPDDTKGLDDAWTGLARPALALDPRADWNAFCEASYEAGRDLFRAVERDLGTEAVDRIIRRLFAPGAPPDLLLLLRSAYAGKTPHPVVERLVGPLDPFAPTDRPKPTPAGAPAIAARWNKATK